MSKTQYVSGDWIVVCDGRKALVLENAGDGLYPNFRLRESHEHKDSATHEMGTDTPGRVHASVGTARSAVEQTDWHDRAEQDFLRAMAQKLDEWLRTGSVKSLSIVAPPRALAVLRAAYTPAVRAAIKHELAKDLVKMPIREIEKHLTA